MIKSIKLSALISGLIFVQAAHATTIDLASDIKACSQISQDKARLTCFDKLGRGEQSASAVASTAVLSTAAISTALTPRSSKLNEQQIDAFAKEHVEKTAEEKANEILSISLTISKLVKTTRGQWKITFKNGQKWQQKDSTKLKLKLDDKVTLTKGALNSVYLQKENTNKRIKVKRLK
ncbi:hypothetical protein [Colwellia piezophila]|uniref:hypothetical protein n=1 Tax=Colwellia piezophila TaxID=211668 RepID=UPI00035D7F89|nr:hypothetical protein [Colwellia piezophila]